LTLATKKGTLSSLTDQEREGGAPYQSFKDLERRRGTAQAAVRLFSSCILATTLSLLSSSVYAEPDPLQGAYQQQHRLVTETVRSGSWIAGFKAGLTSTASQSRFGISQPIAGVLTGPAIIQQNQPITLPTNGIMMLETEIAFIMSCSLQARVAALSTLKACVGAVAPAIELPELAAETLANLTANGLVSTNVGAARVLLGPAHSSQQVELNSLAVNLQDAAGNTVTTGQGSDALGDQWVALSWLVNQIIAQGWAIQPGQVLITGALGAPTPAKPGTYQASFGALGAIRFTIATREP